MSTAKTTPAAAPIVLPPLVWAPSPNYSSRHGQPVDLVVVHESAGHYATDVAWLRNDSIPPEERVSAHLVLREDGHECSQLVGYADKAWTQAAYNPRALSIELSNVTAKGYATEHQLDVAARIVGFLLRRFHLPPRYARGGVGKGFTRHLELGAAGGGHTQCGPSDEPWHRFVAMVAHEHARGDYRKTWGRG